MTDGGWMGAGEVGGTGMMSLKDVRWGEGEGVSNPEAFLADGSIGLGRERPREDPKLPGDMNRETMSWDPSFSHLLLSSCAKLAELNDNLAHSVWMHGKNRQIRIGK
jgi:hypothetical protein